MYCIYRINMLEYKEFDCRIYNIISLRQELKNGGFCTFKKYGVQSNNIWLNMLMKKK